jgi:hypothetical protein
MMPRDQMRTLIRQGLSPDNLDQLIDIARRLFYERPALYGSLIVVFKDLSCEFDDQGIIDISRYDLINRTFEPPMIAAIDAHFDPTLLDRLNDLHRTLFEFS